MSWEARTHTLFATVYYTWDNMRERICAESINSNSTSGIAFYANKFSFPLACCFHTFIFILFIVFDWDLNESNRTAKAATESEKEKEPNRFREKRIKTNRAYIQEVEMRQNKKKRETNPFGILGKEIQSHALERSRWRIYLLTNALNEPFVLRAYSLLSSQNRETWMISSICIRAFFHLIALLLFPYLFCVWYTSVSAGAFHPIKYFWVEGR